MAHSALLTQEIRLRTRSPGTRDSVAAEFGITAPQVSQLRHGSGIGTKSASRILAALRKEDQALADRIEDELVASWREELRTETQR